MKFNKRITALVCSLTLITGVVATMQFSEARIIDATFDNIKKYPVTKSGFKETESPYDLNTVGGVKKEHVRYINNYIEWFCTEKLKITPWQMPYGNSTKEIPKLTEVKDSPAYTKAVENYLADKKFKEAKFDKTKRVTGVKIYRSNLSSLIEFDRFGGAKKYNIYVSSRGVKKIKTKKKHTQFDYSGNKIKVKYVYKRKNKWTKYKLLGTVSENDYKMIDYSKRQFVFYKKSKVKYNMRSKYRIKVLAVDGANNKSNYSIVKKSNNIKKPKKVFFSYDVIPKVNYYRMNHVYKDADGKKIGKGKDIGISKALWCHAWEKGVKTRNKRQRKLKASHHVGKKGDWDYLKDKKWDSEYNKARTGAPTDENCGEGIGSPSDIAGFYKSPGHRPGIIQGYLGDINDSYFCSGYTANNDGFVSIYGSYSVHTFGVCCAGTSYKLYNDWGASCEYVSGDMREIIGNEYRASTVLCNGMPNFRFKVESNSELSDYLKMLWEDYSVPLYIKEKQ